VKFLPFSFLACLVFVSTASRTVAAGDFLLRDSGETSVVVSVPDQKLVVLHDGLRIAQFPISTSKFGLGDSPRSYATPLGMLEVAAKVGDNAPAGTVFKGRRPTGEILRPNARGRDPIVTRILCLRGLESSNANAYGRGIYIHGTPVERQIGKRASFGCIRMKSKDVVRVFEAVPVGTKIEISNQRLNQAVSLHAMKHTVRRAPGIASN
jgi:hypothetical protein